MYMKEARRIEFEYCCRCLSSDDEGSRNDGFEGYTDHALAVEEVLHYYSRLSLHMTSFYRNCWWAFSWTRIRPSRSLHNSMRKLTLDSKALAFEAINGLSLNSIACSNIWGMWHLHPCIEGCSSLYICSPILPLYPPFRSFYFSCWLL